MRSIRLVICAFAFVTLNTACGGGTTTDPTDTTDTDIQISTDEGQGDEGVELDEGQVALNCDENNGGCDANATCSLEADAVVCSCVEGFEGDGLTCADMDECALDNDCGQICTNTEGSYECSCEDGFNLGADGRTCSDVDECSAGTHNCDIKAICANNDGSFDCSCIEGYEGDGTTCSDTDECALETDDCVEPFVCSNTEGNFECVCDAGYGLNDTADACEDVDECLLEADNCSENADCTNLDGSFECACALGFEGDGVDCADIDECATLEDACGDGGAMATCENSEGSFECACPEGYVYNAASLACEDVNECDFPGEFCDVNAECTNSEGSFECACGAGFDGDGLTCTDVDECDLGQADCHESSSCQNTEGAFECICAEGFAYDGVDTGCADVDECTTNSHDCLDNEYCTNDEGSFTCTSCGDGTEVGPDALSCVPCDGASAGTGGVCTACEPGLIATEDKTSCVIPGCGVDVTGADFPYEWPGTFDDNDPDFVTPSCDETVTNAVWFTFVAPESAYYAVNLVNATSDFAYSRLAVYSSDSTVLTADTCDPIYDEQFCMTSSNKEISTVLELVAGEVYLLLFFTDGDTYSMEDPEISIEQMVPTDTDTCDLSMDISDEIFPFEFSQDYLLPQSDGNTCNATPGSAVWVTYTAAESGIFVVTGSNTGGASYDPTGVAVYMTDDCTALVDNEVECESGSNKTSSVAVDFVEGTTYTIQFFMDDIGDSLSNPSFDIVPIIPGTQCDSPVSLDGLDGEVVTSEGVFNMTTEIIGSCDTDTLPGKSFWASFTPEESGLFDFSFENNTTTGAWSRMAVFAGGTCDELGGEVACLKVNSKTIDTPLELEGGVTYRILLYTDGTTYTMVNPTVSMTEVFTGPGDTCGGAIDLSVESLPYFADGTFDVDPISGSSCDTTPTNAVWFDYLATESGLHNVSVINETGTGEVHLAIFDTVACGPVGTEIACIPGPTDTAAAAATVYLDADMGYKILVHTDSDTTDLLNPELNIQPILVGEGDVCTQALPFSDSDLPYTILGDFDVDGPIGGSCDTAPNNVAWAQYTATETGAMTVTSQLEDTDGKIRMVVYGGEACDPLGEELICEASDTNIATAGLSVVAGQVYNIAIYTDAETTLNSNPMIMVEPFSADPGQHCLSSFDVTGLTMAYGGDETCPEGAECASLEGTFSDDPSAGGSCDTTPNNAAWFKYTAGSTGPYKISAINSSTSIAYSRLAVFEGTDCGVLANEVGCATSSNKTPTLTVELEEGKTYTIMLHTDDYGSDIYTMIDPQIKVEPFSYILGESCETIVDIPPSGEPLTVEGSFSGAMPTDTTSCSDSSPTNAFWFGYFPIEAGTYTVTVQNQTTTFAWSRLAIFEGFSCEPLPTELSCDQVNGKTVTKTVEMTAGTPYMFLFYTDGTTYTMVNPIVTIELTTPATPPEPPAPEE